MEGYHYHIVITCIITIFFCVLFSKWTNGKAIVQYDNSQGSSRKLVTDPLENNAFSAFQQWSESDTFQNLMVAWTEILNHGKFWVYYSMYLQFMFTASFPSSKQIVTVSIKKGVWTISPPGGASQLLATTCWLEKKPWTTHTPTIIYLNGFVWK